MMEHRFKYSILACGADSKGRFAIGKGYKLFLSKEFGSLENYRNLSRYERKIKRDLRRFNVRPQRIACDMHPGYHSTIFAKEITPNPKRLIRVQHHHAHIASCMYDNNLKKKVIGIALDGTGYGTDGKIWGGEFLISGYRSFKRAAHFKYLPMPGADMAIKEPWRMSAAYLWDAFGDRFLDLKIPFVRKIKRRSWGILKYMIDENINTPMTSSAGRLFDAIASIVLSIFHVKHEAQAAMRLETLASQARNEKRAYKYKTTKDKESIIIDTKDIIKRIVKDIKYGVKAPIIAARFHNTLACIIHDISFRIKRETGIDRVALSGGVFQNRLLLEKVNALLEESGFHVYKHSKYSTTDASIAIGQAMIADTR